MKLLCIDGNSVLNRAFYGIKVLTTSDGRYTNAIFGFMNIFTKLLDEHKPDAVAVAFDLRDKTFRHKMYDSYKATRKGMPEELAQQLPVLQELLRALGYAVVTCSGYEADDILGTFSHRCKTDGNDCIIATGDRDSLQLIGDGTVVALTTTHFGKGETSVIDTAAVYETYGVEPLQLIEVKALMGDSSDNVPGVAGVGEKTALALITKYGSLDGVYENINSPDIKDGVRAKLTADRDSAYLSRELVTISHKVPIDSALSSYIPSPRNDAEAARILRELEMYSMITKLNLTDSVPAEKVKTEAVFARPMKGALDSIKELWLLEDENGLSGFDGKNVYFLTPSELIDTLRSNVKKNCFDSKSMFRRAVSAGITAQNMAFDIKLAAYLLNPLSGDYSAERLAAEYHVRADIECDDYPDTPSLAKLSAALERRISDEGMGELLREVEQPLAKVLAKMELEGFMLDVDGIKAFGEELQNAINNELEQVYSCAGREFNLNSPKQLGEVLFETLKLPIVKKTKSGYSTDADTLDKLRGSHPIIGHILSYRTYYKLNSTYVAGLLGAVDRSGHVHTEFNQTETRTGRISSSNPNLQNIPVRTELGSRFRKYFVAEEGRVLLDADYSQIELRVLAHISKDKRMTDAFLNGRDIHTETAAGIFRVPSNEVTPELRRRAKAVNFGIVYGIGAFSLAADVGVSVSEADRYIKDYLETYSGVRDYLARTVENAQRDGYVATMFGRRRSLPELANSNKNIAALGKRLAMNTPIQGTAADIIKIAMVRVDERLERENIDAKLILQVHDELIVSAAEDVADRAAAILREEMESAVKLDAPLVADVGRGKSWYDAK